MSGIYINGIQKGLVAPLADATGSDTVAEVVGSKTDTVAGTSLVALIKQTIADMAKASANSSGDSSGTLSYLDAGGEQTIVELTTTTRKHIYGISLDLSNITIDAAVIKVYLKPDGTNYREIQAKRLTFNASTDGDGVYIDLNMGITSDFKVTFTEGGDEGADRDIPYSLVYRTIE